MNKIIKDILREDFTRHEVIVYGIIVPLSFIALAGIAGWLASMV